MIPNEVVVFSTENNKSKKPPSPLTILKTKKTKASQVTKVTKMCLEHVYHTVCWNCNREHGAIRTQQERCERARQRALRPGGCGRMSRFDHVYHYPCTLCQNRRWRGYQ
ncbi:hypothetical protein QBC45DRAFT_431445 [Copromyces sp. CBS 386.78]|nr:hypothetical protein QBC45DRAFT_431445 [Copromyces sp. CBS 386.78]